MGQMIDVADAHRVFASAQFNACWDLLGKSERNATESLLLVSCAHASFFHWINYPEHSAENVNIGFWMLSRANAVAAKDLGEKSFYLQALFFAQQCIEQGERTQQPPFFQSYGHEALARAALGLGETERAAQALEQAKLLAKSVESEEERAMLEADIAELG